MRWRNEKAITVIFTSRYCLHDITQTMLVEQRFYTLYFYIFQSYMYFTCTGHSCAAQLNHNGRMLLIKFQDGDCCSHVTYLGVVRITVVEQTVTEVIAERLEIRRREMLAFHFTARWARKRGLQAKNMTVWVQNMCTVRAHKTCMYFALVHDMVEIFRLHCKRTCDVTLTSMV